jgi:prepilin-type N-terminal cleavage/methylation domain-containing protein
MSSSRRITSFGRSRVAESGFTLVELLFSVIMMGMLLMLTYPSIQSLSDQAQYSQCAGRLEAIKRAKSAYVVDHLGQGNPTTTQDTQVFQMYFVNPFPFTCPRDTNTQYSNVYNMYQPAVCPYCATNVPGTVKRHQDDDENE